MSAPLSPDSALARIAVELKAARIFRGLSLHEVSRLLKYRNIIFQSLRMGDFSFLSCAYVFAYIKEYAREMGVGDDERINACRRELGVLIGLKETGLSDYLKLSSPAAFRNSDFYFLCGVSVKRTLFISLWHLPHCLLLLPERSRFSQVAMKKSSLRRLSVIQLLRLV